MRQVLHKGQRQARQLGQQLTAEASLSEQQGLRLRHQCRLQAATLLEAVIDETITAQMAINRWPDHPLVKDPSLNCALQALWHFEADEDLHQSEMFYLDVQLELLRQMWRCLRTGKDLPPHLLKNFSPELGLQYYYPVENPWQMARHEIQQGFRDFYQLLIQSLRALPGQRKQ